MANKTETQAAVFSKVTELLANEELAAWGLDKQAEIVRNLALAYRYAAGGTQPGSVVVEK